MIGRRRHIEAECIAAFAPPISLFQPDRLAAPLVLASPHSGRVYPEAFVNRSSQSLNVLRQNEDAYIDELLGFAKQLDIPLLNANFPRCYVDVNRAPDEIPVSWQKPGAAPSTARAEIGLGVIPTIIADKVPIYKRPLKPRQALARLDAIYHPYHHALTELITNALREFGHALLLDCHSMPGFNQLGQRRPDIVLGDRHGASCHPGTISKLENLFSRAGYSVARNYPYAGGFVTQHYGRPADNMEVVQIEINRDIYLNPINYKRKKAYAKLASDLQSICWAMFPLTHSVPIAAE